MQEKPTIYFALINLESFKEEEIRLMAEKVIAPFPSDEKRGHIHYWGGRAALQDLFLKLSMNYRVRPNAEFGYLEIIDEQGQLVKNFSVSISHTEKVAIAAIAECPIGVDIENISRQTDKVAPKILNQVESDYFQKFPKIVFGESEISTSLLYWTAKESASKACGLGMRRGLALFEVGALGTLPYQITIPENSPIPLNNAAVTYLLFGDYLISFCADSESIALGVWGWWVGSDS